MRKLIERETSLEILQTELYVKQFMRSEFAANPVFVFLHDALGCAASWKDFPEDLCETCQLNGFLYDRLGHGKSQESIELRDPWYLHKEAFEVLPAILEVMEISKPLIFGHSDGASIALLYASRFPVSGLILEAPHVVVEPITLSGIRNATQNRTELERRLERYHGDKTIRLVSAWADTWLDDSFQFWNITPALEAIHCPVMVIQGDEDEYGTIGQAASIEELTSGPCTSTIMQGCNHIPHKQNRAYVLELTQNFMRTHFISDRKKSI